MLRTKRKVPSLVDLCVSLAVENVKYLGDVGETDLHLLDRILPHCTLDQLMHIEKSTVVRIYYHLYFSYFNFNPSFPLFFFYCFVSFIQGRDLSSVTDKLWKTFYEKQFGERSTDVVIQRMRQKKVSFRWLQLYEVLSIWKIKIPHKKLLSPIKLCGMTSFQAKLKDIAEAENKLAARIRQLYKKEDDSMFFYLFSKYIKKLNLLIFYFFSIRDLCLLVVCHMV
jgi:elongin-A